MAEGLIGGLLQAIFVWLVIIVVGAVLGLSTKKRAVRYSIFALSILSLPIYIAFELSGIENHFEQQSFDREKKAFAAYCKGRKHQIYARATEATPILGIETVAIDPIELHADFFVNRLNEKAAADNLKRLCTSTNVKYIEGIELSREKYRVGLCKPMRTKIDDWSATHMIRFGPKYDIAKNPQSSHRPFSKIPMQLIELSTGKILAEDTLFNYTFASRDAGCPYVADQLVEMIFAVFDQKYVDDPSRPSNSSLHSIPQAGR